MLPLDLLEEGEAEDRSLRYSAAGRAVAFGCRLAGRGVLDEALRPGYFGASTGAAAVPAATADQPERVGAGGIAGRPARLGRPRPDQSSLQPC